MTIHTMWSQAGGGLAATPQGRDDVGTGPAGGAGGAGEGAGGRGGGGAVTSEGAALAPPASGGGVAATRAPAACPPRRGARTRASRVASTTRSRPLVASDSATTPLALTRRVTSTAVQRFARSAPVCTTRGPVPGARRIVMRRSFHGSSEAWRRRSPLFELVSG